MQDAAEDPINVVVDRLECLSIYDCQRIVGRCGHLLGVGLVPFVPNRHQRLFVCLAKNDGSVGIEAVATQELDGALLLKDFQHLTFTIRG